MAPKMNRTKALEYAQVAMRRMLDEKYRTLQMAKAKYTPDGIAEVEAEYAELAAALAWLENAARQKQLEL